MVTTTDVNQLVQTFPNLQRLIIESEFVHEPDIDNDKQLAYVAVTNPNSNSEGWPTSFQCCTHLHTTEGLPGDAVPYLRNRKLNLVAGEEAVDMIAAMYNPNLEFLHLAIVNVEDYYAFKAPNLAHFPKLAWFHLRVDLAAVLSSGLVQMFTSDYPKLSSTVHVLEINNAAPALQRRPKLQQILQFIQTSTVFRNVHILLTNFSSSDAILYDVDKCLHFSSKKSALRHVHRIHFPSKKQH